MVLIDAKYGIWANGNNAAIVSDDVYFAIRSGSDSLLFVYLLADSDRSGFIGLSRHESAARKGINGTKYSGRFGDSADRQQYQQGKCAFQDYSRVSKCWCHTSVVRGY